MDRLTDVQYLAALGVPVSDIADRAGVSEYAISVELAQSNEREDD